MKSSHPHHKDLGDYRIIPDPEYGYLRLDPVPTEEDILEMYTENFYEQHCPGWIHKTLAEKDYWTTIFNERFDIMERFLAKAQKKSLRVLDVGSFIGLFLSVGKERGWDVLGIEPSKQASDYANNAGINTHRGLFEDFDREFTGKFHALNLELVLEHVRHPALVLKKAHDFLFPEGIICVTVPNEYNLLQKSVTRTLKLHEYWVCPPHHINYFSFDSLSSLLEKTGFDIVKRYATFPMEFFLLMGANYIGKDDIGLNCHQKRMTFEQNLHKSGLKELKEKLYSFFAQEGIGREIVLFAQKK